MPGPGRNATRCPEGRLTICIIYDTLQKLDKLLFYEALIAQRVFSMFSIVFFKTDIGNEPVRDWLRGLSKEERAVIGADLRTLQIGFPLGMPLCRPLGSALYEVRSSLPSRREARLIFFQDHEQLVVVCGFIKKSRNTPDSELKNARKRQGEYKKNKDNLERSNRK